MRSPDPIFEILGGYRLSAALKAAIDLGVFAAMGNGRRTVRAVAKQVRSSERGIRILLDALQTTPLVTKGKGGYRLTPLARQFLVPGTPTYIGWVSRLSMHPKMWSSFGELTSAVRRGGTVLRSHAHSEDQSFWEDFANVVKEDARRLARGLVKILRIGRKPLRAIDLACGSGMYGLSVAEANPKAEVTFLDRQNVLRHTRRHTGGRFRYIPGDIFKTNYRGPYDLAIASHVLHHFGPAANGRLLRRIARSLRPGGRLAVQEFLTDDARKRRTRPLLFSLTMLVWTREGEAFSFREMRRMLTENGFRRIRFHYREQPSQWIIAERAPQ